MARTRPISRWPLTIPSVLHLKFFLREGGTDMVAQGSCNTYLIWQLCPSEYRVHHQISLETCSWRFHRLVCHNYSCPAVGKTKYVTLKKTHKVNLADWHDGAQCSYSARYSFSPVLQSPEIKFTNSEVIGRWSEKLLSWELSYDI